MSGEPLPPSGPALLFVCESKHHAVYRLHGADGLSFGDAIAATLPLLDQFYANGYHLCASELSAQGRLIFEKPI